MTAGPVIVPFMPLFRAYPKAAYPADRKFPLYVLRQGVGLRNVRNDMISAAV
jgi:hypothetical protein